MVDNGFTTCTSGTFTTAYYDYTPTTIATPCMAHRDYGRSTPARAPEEEKPKPKKNNPIPPFLRAKTRRGQF